MTVDLVSGLMAVGPMEDPPAEAAHALGQAIGSDRMLTEDELSTLIFLAGRINGPDFLAEAWYGQIIEPDVLASLVGLVWSRAEFPDRSLDADVWADLFAVAGFTVDGVRAAPPAAPVELWRGSVPDRRADWSWSTDRAVAEQYAQGFHRRPRGRLYRLLAPPEVLLCANPTCRMEAEYVVDTRTVAADIVEVAAYDG